MSRGSTVRVFLVIILFLYSPRLVAQQAQAAVDGDPASLVRAEGNTSTRVGSILRPPGLKGSEPAAQQQEELPASLSLTFQRESKRPIWVLPLAGAVAGGLIGKLFHPADFGEGSCNPPNCRRNGSPFLRGAALGAAAGFVLDRLLEPDES